MALALILASCAAVTDPATNVTPNRARLNAHGHTDSTPASYYFAYATDPADLGTDAEFDTQVVVVPPGAHGPNGEDIPFAAPTATLRPDTTYYFRVCGGDDVLNRLVCANTRSFTTPPNPDVTLKSTQYGTSGSCCVGTADFNRDGILDIVTSGNANPGFTRPVSLMFGDGNGGFGAEQEFGPQEGTDAIAVGDFNRDGKKDIAYSASGVKVLLGDGTGGFSAGPQSGSGCRFTEARDVNRDGKLDLVGTSGLHLSLWACVAFGDGAGGFSASDPIDPDERPLIATVADVSRDGRPDLVVGTAGAQLGGPTGVSVLPGTSSGTFGAPLHTALPSGRAPHRHRRRRLQPRRDPRRGRVNAGAPRKAGTGLAARRHLERRAGGGGAGTQPAGVRARRGRPRRQRHARPGLRAGRGPAPLRR